MWDKLSVEIEEIFMHKQILNVMIKDTLRGSWILTVVYASSKIMCWDDLWSYIREMGNIITIPWLLIGDFNQPLDDLDKFGGMRVNKNQGGKLQYVINSCQLLDVSFQGPK